MVSPFLENLKKAVENEEFNSEAAKKIIEINNLADTKFVPKTNEELTTKLNEVKAKLSDDNLPPVTEEEAAAMKAEYDAHMEDIKKRDVVNIQLATLVEIEDMVKLSVIDMLMFIDELEDKFSSELDKANPMFIDLITKIEEIKKNYKEFIEYISNFKK